MNIILFDSPTTVENLKPFTFTRPVSEIRVGMMTIKEKWEKRLNKRVSYLTEQYLQEKFPLHLDTDNVYIDASLLPDDNLAEIISQITEEESIKWNGKLLAYRTSKHLTTAKSLLSLTKESVTETSQEIVDIEYPWDIFKQNKSQIQADFDILTKGKQSAPITDKHTVIYGEDNIFIEEGVKIRAAVLNAETGPIYISKGAEISEGVLIRGACFIGEGTKINMGAKIHEDCTFGPYCKIGGEVSNTVFFGFSNKGHDGFLGNTVVGEWCNFGADTNSSNLKNNYGEVRVWNYKEDKYISSGQTFCGVLMGDYAKTGINTMLNTGTVVGVSANIFGGGFPAKHVPSFIWGGIEDSSTADLGKMCEVATKVAARRKRDFTEADRKILSEVFRMTVKYRQ